MGFLTRFIPGFGSADEHGGIEIGTPGAYTVKASAAPPDAVEPQVLIGK